MASASAARVLSHWYNLIEGLQASAMDFYASVEAAIQKRELSAARTSRVQWFEGGVLSARREYLRVSRGTHVFDICAAPFGNGSFVSWWLVEKRPSPGGPTALAIAGSLLVWYVMSNHLYSAIWGFIATLLLWVAVFFFLGFLASISDDSGQFSAVATIPIVGPPFERLFLPVTYYRIDTALMFQSIVHAAVLEVLDGLIQAKGLRALSESERKPILQDFLRRRR